MKQQQKERSVVLLSAVLDDENTFRCCVQLDDDGQDGKFESRLAQEKAAGSYGGGGAG